MDAFIKNYVTVAKNATQFSGRSGRSEYWMFFAVNLALGVVLNVVDAITGFPVLGVLFMLLVLLPGIAITIRRLHDTDRSGWWMLISLVPIVGAIAVLVLMALKGTEGSNQFGAPGETPSPEIASA